MFLDMALRSVWRQRVRSGLTILGIIMAIGAIVSLGSFSEGINSLVNEQLKFASGFITVEEEGQTATGQGPPGMESKVELSIVEEIRQISGVEEASPGIFSLEPNGNIFVVGVSLDNVEYFDLQNIEFTEGGWPENGENELALGSQLAERKGLVAGDTIELRSEEYEVAGLLEEMGNFMDLGAITSFEAARETFDFGDYASMIMVEPVDAGEIDRIAAEIEGSYDGIEAKTPEERVETAKETTAMVSIFTLGIGVVASIVASIGIINTMFMIVMERRKEFGIMKALGAERWSILGIVITEAVILGAVGGIVGIGLGFIGTDVLNSLYPFRLASISLRLVAISFAYSILLAVLAALYPAYQAVKVNPVEAMRK